MKKILVAGMAMVALAGSVLTTASPAVADGRDWRGGENHGRDRDRRSGDGENHWRDRGGEGRDRDGYGYGYGQGYYGRGYGVCTARRSVWNPYVGRYVVRRYQYSC